jgi:threonine dehydrogenase-like Zn-dependent dehydrogenase
MILTCARDCERCVLWSLGRGRRAFEDVDMPVCESEGIVVKVRVTTISTGTELRGYDTRAADDEGLFMHANVPYELPTENGYSFVGEVVEVGPEVCDLSVGDRMFVPMFHKEYAAASRRCDQAA